MSEVRQRGAIRAIMGVLLIGFMCFWFLRGFWDAIKLTGAMVIISLLFTGIMALTYETDTVLEWLGNLKFQSSTGKAKKDD